MKVFCPNCGQANEAQPGQRLTCSACTAMFDAPSAAGMAPPPPPPPPPPAPAPAPPQAYPAPTYAMPQVQPAPQWQAPYPGQVAGTGPKTNTLAIISLVTSIICCAPAGIVLGIMALNQIKNDPTQTGKGLAIAGIVLGGLGMLVGFIWFLAALAGGVG